MESLMLLIRCCTLLYRESQLPDSSYNSKDLVTEILEFVKLPDQMDIDRSRDILIGLKTVVQKLAHRDGVDEIALSTLKQDVKLACGERRDLYDTFLLDIEETDNIDEIKKLRNNYVNEINGFLRYNTVMSSFNELYKKLRLSDRFNYTERLVAINQLIEPIINKSSMDETEQDDDIILSSVMKLEEAFELAAVDDNPKLYLKIGWQWFREILGSPQALKRGDQCLLYALPHNYKSGFTLNTFRQIVQYNPNFQTLDPTKKPILIHLSTENHLTNNLRDLYRFIKENETGELCDVNNINRDEAAAYLREWASSRGWEVSLLRRNPSDLTYRDIVALVTKFESLGYEVVGFFIDYLAMCNTRGCWTGQGGGTGMDIRALFRRCRNFFSENHILSFTPHQLSTEAKRRQPNFSPATFLENIVGQGLLDSCGTLDQEADLELYIHLIRQKEATYLSAHRGKHRGVDNTPMIHFKKYVPFQDVAGLPDDIGASRAIPKIPGSSAEVQDW